MLDTNNFFLKNREITENTLNILSTYTSNVNFVDHPDKDWHGIGGQHLGQFPMQIRDQLGQIRYIVVVLVVVLAFIWGQGYHSSSAFGLGNLKREFLINFS